MKKLTCSRSKWTNLDEEVNLFGEKWHGICCFPSCLPLGRPVLPLPRAPPFGRRRFSSPSARPPTPAGEPRAKKNGAPTKNPSHQHMHGLGSRAHRRNRQQKILSHQHMSWAVVRQHVARVWPSYVCRNPKLVSVFSLGYSSTPRWLEPVLWPRTGLCELMWEQQQQ